MTVHHIRVPESLSRRLFARARWERGWESGVMVDLECKHDAGWTGSILTWAHWLPWNQNRRPLSAQTSGQSGGEKS